MESELAACPVCGGECKLLNDNDGAAYCVSPDCGHYEVLPVEMHNALARHAEVGRLVEQLTDACRVVPMIGKGEDLLTELRALAKEVSGDR